MQARSWRPFPILCKTSWKRWLSCDYRRRTLCHSVPAYVFGCQILSALFINSVFVVQTMAAFYLFKICRLNIFIKSG